MQADAGLNPQGERLQKVLAHAGLGSRRSCEDFISQGRVTVNGEVVREVGVKVVSGDRIAVDGEPIREERPAYIAVNKPKGYVSTNSDPSGRPRVIDLVPEIPQRVYTVGRLDEMSVGLMLLTNDGELANKLAHPKYGVEKIYRAVVAGNPEPDVYRKLVEGVWLAEGKVRAKRVKPISRQGEATVLEMVLAEGKNREVRRMLAKFGHKVMSLTRVAIGPITLKGLKPGGWRFLTAREVDLLRKVADGMPVPMGRFGPERERPMRPPTRGPRAYQAQGQAPPMGPRAGGSPSRPRMQGGPAGPQGGPPHRPRMHGGPEGSQGGPPPRPRLYGEPAGPQQGGPPPRPRMQGGPAGPHQGGPPRRPPGPAGGPGPRPRYAAGPMQGQGPPPGPRGRRPPGGPARGPVPPPIPQGPPPSRRPPRDEMPARRIIGLELPSERQGPPGPGRGRPMKRRPPGPGRKPSIAPRRRLPKRPGEGGDSE